MDAKEFRTGNYLFWTIRNEDGGAITAKIPKPLTGKQIAAIEELGERASDFYEPIPLTHEILESAGFEKDNIDNLDGYSIFSRLTIFLEPVLCEDGRIEWSTYVQFNIGMGFNELVTNPPEYLHEVQNLYYALTGKELTINLHAAV